MRPLILAIGVVLATLPFRSSADAAGANEASCVEHMSRNWTRAEQVTWKDLCSIGAEFFGDSFGGKLDPDKDAGWDASGRAIRVEFLRTIMSDPLASLIPNRKVYLDNALVVGDEEIYGLTVAGFTCDRCRFEGDLNIRSSNLDSLDVFGAVTGAFILDAVNLRSALISVSVPEGKQLFIHNLTINGDMEISGTFPTLIAQTAKVNGSIHFGGKCTTISLAELRVSGDVYVGFQKDDQIQNVVLRQSTIDGRLNVNPSFVDSSDLIFYDVRANRFYLGSEPSKVALTGFDFDNWMGDDSTSTDRIVSTLSKDKDFDRVLYERVAGSLRREGLDSFADQVAYAKMERERSVASGVERAYLTFEWAVTGYGLRPQLGLAWFGGLIIAAYLIFRSGTKYVRDGVVPRSWLVFAIDTVIPVINLDEEHKKISFVGWRQYFLYVMKGASAVLVYLVFKVLEKGFS